ncbi:MAG: NifU family protein [Acidimicrobiia bacterium]|nr:NifU family protein [Acidimicrobiia bacterium]MXX46386.1 NifU family protein [Acidimicrobiia bacterium]MXY74737.1 NifU family protein [Acidimicrobiia bacterium]MYA39380.1 NifU family protein [Acidimicrobiia bacterium]MYB78915.1 NifU family protein [Acidimicrobiia bacterium]
MTETILELPRRQAERPAGPSLPEVDLKLLEAALDYIRPAVQVDGGDLILLGVEEGVVSIQMVGACGGCPLSMMTLKEGIERILKAKVPGVVSVEAVA